MRGFTKIGAGLAGISRQAVLWATLPLTITILPPAPPPTAPADTMTVANVSGTPADYPLQFGRPFVPGEIAHYPQALVNGTPIATQADVKNRWPDGSVKFAVVSVVLPQLSNSVTLSFQDQASGNNGALTQADMLDPAYNFDATISLTSNGSTVSASARQMLSDGAYTVWTSGPIAQTIVLADDTMARRYDMGFDALKPIRPRFVATFWPALHKVSVAAVGEDELSTALEDMQADLTITGGANGKAYSYSHPALITYAQTRWLKRFWLGGDPIEQVNIDYNAGYVAATHAVANYDPKWREADANIAGDYAGWQSGHHDLYESGGSDPGRQTGAWEPYQPQVGGRDDIGPAPGWYVRWFLSGDWRLRERAEGMADLAGAWPAYTRVGDDGRYLDVRHSAAALGHMMDIFSHTNGEQPQIQGARLGSNAFVIDDAHPPDAYYVPYLLTGDPLYLEGEEMWAGWQSTQWLYHGPIGRAAIQVSQVRQVAWELRTRTNAAWIAPDGSPEQIGLRDIMEDGLTGLSAMFGVNAPTRASDPLYVMMFNPNPNPIHVIGVGNPINNDKACCDAQTSTYMAAWQEPLVNAMVGRAWELGYDVLPLWRWLMQEPLGQFAAVPQGYNIYLLGAYHLSATDLAGNPWPTWMDVQNHTAPATLAQWDEARFIGQAADLGDGYANYVSTAFAIMQPLEPAPWAWIHQYTQDRFDYSVVSKQAIIPRADANPVPAPVVPVLPSHLTFPMGSAVHMTTRSIVSGGPFNAYGWACNSPLNPGTTATVLWSSGKDDWYDVRFSDGCTGWLPASVLAPG